jgi:hypothetical protein
MSDTLYFWNGIPKDPISLNKAMNTLRQDGLSGHLTGVIGQCWQMAAFADYAASGGGGGPVPMVKGRFGLHPNVPPQPHSSYNCAVDGAAILAMGTAFIIIGIMAGPAGVLALAFWGPLSFWGGTAVGAWGLGHVVAGCSF